MILSWSLEIENSRSLRSPLSRSSGKGKYRQITPGILTDRASSHSCDKLFHHDQRA
jgi:hypothetical protein